MYKNIDYHIDYVYNAHTFSSRSPEKAFRRFDGITPYIVHPLWCATMISMEQNLPQSLRENGFYVLLYHDVLEDTTKYLPDSLSLELKKDIEDMVFANSEDEMQNIIRKDKKIRLFKFYDKVNNCFNIDNWPNEKVEKYMDYTEYLAEDVKNNYGILNIHYVWEGLKKKLLEKFIEEKIAVFAILLNSKGQILTIDRSVEPYGIGLPGGMVNEFEYADQAIVREIFEKTGLVIPGEYDNGHEHVWKIHSDYSYKDKTYLLGYFITYFEGELKSSDEGKVQWMNIDEFKQKTIYEGFNLRLLEKSIKFENRICNKKLPTLITSI